MAIDTEDKRRQALFIFPSPDSSVDNDDRTILLPVFRIGTISAATIISIIIAVDMYTRLNLAENMETSLNVAEDVSTSLNVSETVNIGGI